MSETYLAKPSPKYIYAIIMNTMKVTGFPNGLFTNDETNPKYFEESTQNKTVIIQKAIDITKIILNNNINIIFYILIL